MVDVVDERKRSEGQVSLDRLDKEILYELDCDASQSLSAIARKVGRSVPAVGQRISKLVERRVLKSFLTNINNSKLGYTDYSLYCSLRNLSAEKERKMVDKIAKNEHVNALFRWDGTWDLCIGVLANDMFELSSVVSGIRNEFNKYIDKEALTVHMGAYHFGRRYFVPESKWHIETKKAPEKERKPTLIEIDNKEDKLLRALRGGARLSIFELADKAKLPPDVVRYRLKKLKEKGIVWGASILPDYTHFPQMYRLLLNTRGLTSKKEAEMVAYLGTKPNVYKMKKAFGSYDVIIECEFERHADFKEFLFGLKDRFYDIIVNHETLTVTSADKIGSYLG